MIKVACEVAVVEIDGRIIDPNMKDKPVVVVESDWRPAPGMGQHTSQLVVLTIGGKRYGVNGADIETAVKNARNR